MVFKYPRQRSSGLRICLPAVFYIYLCSWFHWYNTTVIACGYRKYDNVFSHEYHIHLGHCPRGIWYSWVNKSSFFPHQHAINVLYEIPDIRIAFTFTANQHVFVITWSYSKIREITIVITVTYVMERRLNKELICTCTLCNVIKFLTVFRFYANYVCTLLI